MQFAHEGSPGTPWLKRLSRVPGAQIRVFCFHHAGVGATFYVPWARILTPFAELWSVQLPGREDRRQEEALSDINQVVPALVREISPYLNVPYALFGHSLGALLSFGVGRTLQRERGVPPVAHFVSGMRAPSLAHTRAPMSALPEAAFVEQLAIRYGGLPEAVLREPDMMAFFLPILRADVGILDSYVYHPADPLRWPLYVLGGKEDAQARGDLLEDWRKEAGDKFEIFHFPGGHFYLQDERERVIALVVRLLQGELKAQAARGSLDKRHHARD